MKRWIMAFSVALLMIGGTVWATPRAMIIFDASGSMWGQVGGVSKIVIARQALKDLLRGWDPKIPLGLTVYGHRRKGDCNDIETLVPIGPLNRTRMERIVDGIQPKGKTPIARSLREVAEQLKKSEDPATIILISDGKESCDADPCAVARELKASGINFVAHVIGFRVDRATDRQLACIAKATGGEYFSARNAAALNRALKQVVHRVEAKPVTFKAKPKPKVPKPAVLELVMLYDSDRDNTITSAGATGAHWWVWQDGKSIYSDDDPLDHQPKIKLHTGTARVKLAYMKSSRPQTRERNVTIRGGEQREVFYIKDGILKVTALSDGKKVKSSIHIYPIVKGKADDIWLRWCVATPQEGCSFDLPIGEYMLEAGCNGSKIKGKIEVRAGTTQPIMLKCPAGSKEVQ